MAKKKQTVTELSPELIPVLVKFSDGENFSDRVQALDRLVSARQIHNASRHTAFELGLRGLVHTASETSVGDDRLLAVSRLALLSAMAPPLRRKIQDELRVALTEPLPPMSSLGGAADRLYVAQACAAAAHSWCPKYLSDSAITEETGENARAECIKALAEQLGDLQDVLRHLRTSLEALVPETESPADSAGRRLRRILAALRPAMARSHVTPGSEPGSVLADILREPFKRYGQPTGARVLEELADESFGAIHELMRASLSLATEASTYAGLRIARGWFEEHKWVSLAAKLKSLQAVAQDLREAVILLAKQNVTDDRLLGLLGLACGNRDRARAVTAEIGRSLPGLSVEIRRSLGAGTGASLDDAPDSEPENIASTSEIMHLADLFVDADLLYREAEAELGSPAASTNQQLKGVLGKALALADSTRSLARRHSMELRGTVGEIVDYSQLDHEMAGGFKLGIRRVRVRRPTVVQLRGSLPHVIRKGLVEPAELSE